MSVTAEQVLQRVLELRGWRKTEREGEKEERWDKRSMKTDPERVREEKIEAEWWQGKRKCGECTKCACLCKRGGVLLSIREIVLDFALSKRFKSVLHCYIGNKMKLGTHITEQIVQRLMPEGHLLIYPLDFPLFSSAFNQDNIISGQN